MSIPIIIFHLGASPFLATVIEVAKYYKNDIILIGDDLAVESAQSKSLHFVNARRFEKSFQSFRRAFVNLSSNSANFEFLCILRWLVIQSYLKETGLRRVLALDSDVLFFGNAEQIFVELFNNSRMTLSNGVSAHTNFLLADFLEQFVVFVTDLYEKKSGFEWDYLVSFYQIMQKNSLPGGVSDMLLFQYFCSSSRSRYIDEITKLNKRSSGLVTFDHNINLGDGGYRISESTSMKEVVFREPGLPSVEHFDFSEPVSFLSLHFQGLAKKWIPVVRENWSKSLEISC